MDLDSDLEQYLQILFRRKWIIASFASVLLATVALGTFTQTPVYRATALLLIEKEQQNYFGAREGALIESSQQDYYQTQYNILKSRSLAQKTVEALGLAQRPEFNGSPEIVGRFLGAVQVAPVVNTRLVNVSAESTDPGLAESMANTLAELYVRQNQESRVFISREVLKAIQADRPDSSIEMYESLPSVVNNRLIQELKIKHAELSAEFANLTKRYTPKHPAVVQVSHQIATMRARIDSEVRKIANSVRAELSGELQGNNVRIVDRAELPKSPVRPRKTLNIALALFFGLALGFALAVFVDRLDRTIKTQEDMENLLKLPFLGAVPNIPVVGQARSGSYLHCAQNPSTASSEAFRNIRTSIAFSSPDGPPRALLVTSSVASEGKTVVSCNLAIVFAQLGERVLLIDGDLRRPMVHTVFGLADSGGLTSYLVGNGQPGDFLAETAIEGLSVLPCGPRPPNPSELLSTHRIGNLLSWASENFDRVIVDGTPIFPVSDALLWSKHIRGVLFVAHAVKVNAALSRRACQKLKDSQARLLGGVINEIRWEGPSYYYNYYQYYRSEEPEKVNASTG